MDLVDQNIPYFQTLDRIFGLVTKKNHNSVDGLEKIALSVYAQNVW